MKRITWILIAFIAFCGIAASARVASPTLIHFVADSESAVTAGSIRDADAVATAFVRGEVWAFDEIRSRLQSKLRRDIRQVRMTCPS